MRRSLSATRTSKLCAIIRLLTVNRSVVTSPPSLRMQPSFVSRGTLHPSSLPHLPRPQSHRTRAAFLHHQPTDARHQRSSPSLLLATFRASSLTTASFCAPESLPRSKTSPHTTEAGAGLGSDTRHPRMLARSSIAECASHEESLQAEFGEESTPRCLLLGSGKELLAQGGPC